MYFSQFFSLFHPTGKSVFFPKGVAVLLFTLFLSCPGGSFAIETPESLRGIGFPRTIFRMSLAHDGASGAYVLDKGEEALLARAWMVNNAVARIDVLTFIWTMDNIGLIATEALLRAAERGVRVRVLVDDMVLEKEALDILLALEHHPFFEIRIYNSVATVGVNPLEKAWNVVSDFRRFNQRMHNKTFMVDHQAAITGGRNVANEYFDYDQEYNFRDRDIFIVGPVVERMRENFERYWDDPLAKPLERLLAKRMNSLNSEEIDYIYQKLHSAAHDLAGDIPIVREALSDHGRRFADILEKLTWSKDIWFVSDDPGKNLGKPGLGGGGKTAAALADEISMARERITIQSPYFILPDGHLGVREASRRGVNVRVSTNSLANTDNTAAFSGYAKQRKDLLDAGFEIREFRPDPAIVKKLIERYLGPEEDAPIFVQHAKTVVIDGKILFIGTFNIDPRSVNLNTEEGIFVLDRNLARGVERQIAEEMLPENSWNPAIEDTDQKAGLWRRVKLWFFKIWPLHPIL